MKFATDELRLLDSALDSHVYWQLSDPAYRNDGDVRNPGSDDPETVKEISKARRLRRFVQMEIAQREVDGEHHVKGEKG